MTRLSKWTTAVAAAALFVTLAASSCQTEVSNHSSAAAIASHSQQLLGDSKLQRGEQCDDGNTVSGDGCSSTGTIEAGYLCHVPGQPCSLASLCGNGVINPGEACDNGGSAGNGCSSTCDLSACGNGAVDNRQYPSFSQELCDDGNRIDGDGCSYLCMPEPDFACAGAPSRCVPTGIRFFNTGVDNNYQKLSSGSDPHWFYAGTSTGAALDVRSGADWPQESQTARFMAPQSGETCVYQDFVIPSTVVPSKFRLRIATFNDNEFYGAKVNGVSWTPVVVGEPPGQPWQKNIVREFGPTAPWKAGLNRLELCNENSTDPPNAFRYLYVSATDDQCGDGVLSPREECDDGNTGSGDGCSSTCGVEATYSCSGQPSQCVAVCGNGVLNPGEQCDDGNPASGDGCSSTCRVEATYACPAPGSPCVAGQCGNGVINAGEQCDDGNTFSSDGCSAACRLESGYQCSGATSTCGRQCGNGRLDPGELCDDGNATSGDGCSLACTLELGYACPNAGAACAKTCGNGTVNPGEQCDDGNLNSGDGCSTECRAEAGYACSTPASGPSVCRDSCGNGAPDANETCDDGNTTGGDGCSPGCRVETGYSCAGVPSVCATLCGDGIAAGAERCDDGNTTAGDGCGSTCQPEAGWVCPAPGNACANTCGDGVLNPGEQCDDGNLANADGCSATCSVEPGFACSGAPSVCVPWCGDALVVGTEACDDGNQSSADACTPLCKRTIGQACTESAQCAALCNPATHLCVAANVCGNGFTEGTEACDDGNLTEDDGCSSSCQRTTGEACTDSAECVEVCNPAAHLCAEADVCGNGFVEGAEVCDDGNLSNDDTCTALCRWAVGQTCTQSSQCAGICNPVTQLCAEENVCGNGILDGSEACDDGNQVNGDTCSPLCKRTLGQACTESGQCEGLCNPVTSICAAANVCGNGVVEGAEACDDGNTANGDTCSSTCKKALGQACTDSAQCDGVCNPVTQLCAAANTCGNGLLDSGEICDDGNLTECDTCSPTCNRTVGQTCAETSECEGVCNPKTLVCAPANVCGNGVHEGDETCDIDTPPTATKSGGCGCNEAPFTSLLGLPMLLLLRRRRQSDRCRA